MLNGSSTVEADAPPAVTAEYGSSGLDKIDSSVSSRAFLPVDTSGRSLTDAIAEVDFDGEGRLPPFPGWRRPLRSLVWGGRGLFGLVSLLLMLAVIAAIPIANFIALGYLLEAEGRVGRSGRFRDGFPLLGLAPRLGTIALGIYVWLLPLRIVSTNAAAAHIISPDSVQDARLQTFKSIAGVVIGLHLCLALARGGSLGCFVRPIKNLRWLLGQLRRGDYLQTASDNVGQFVSGLRLKHHFILGIKGFVAALIWLLVPTLVYATINRPQGPGVLQMLFGGILLVLVLAWTPFLQARVAVENRFRGGLERQQVRDLFSFAPFAWLLALVVTYVLALPLYLFKAFILPRDALWPLTLVFIVSIYPTRLFTGWAYHRATRRREEGLRSRGVSRFTVRFLAMLPLLAVYVFILYFTQFLGAHGKLTLYEHHVFLLPWPYLLGEG
ncbi:MAG: hypothetical protein ACK5Q5_11945 [Planctomycetaceae bacterium]